MDSLGAIVRPYIRITIDIRVNGKDTVRVEFEIRHEHPQEERAHFCILRYASNYKYHR